MNINIRHYSCLTGPITYSVDGWRNARKKVVQLIMENIHQCGVKFGGRVLADLEVEKTWKDGVEYYNQHNILNEEITFTVGK